jgi:hypothetical protein
MGMLAQDPADLSVAKRALWRAMSTGTSDEVADGFEPEAQNKPEPVSDTSAAPIPTSARVARVTVPRASTSVQSEDAVVGKRLSLKVSLSRDRSLAGRYGGVQVPNWARQRSPGSVAKLFMLVAGLVMLTLLLVGGYWTRTPEHVGAGSPTRLRPEPAVLERAAPPPEGDTARAGHQVPAASGEISQPVTTSEPPPLQAVLPAGLPPPPVAVVPTGPVLAPAPAAVPSAAPAPPETVGVGGKASAQLATVFSRKVVTYEWHRLQKHLPGLLGNRELVVSRRHRDGHMRWLLRTNGFDNSAQAAEFCHLVNAKGFHCQVVTAK